jgi:nucleotide-binding universal stress UspA family protein
VKPSPLDTIIVPLDGSALAECAVPVALSLLAPDTGRLILVRVPVYAETQAPIGAEYNMFWPEIRDAPSSFRQVYQDTADYLAHVAARAGKSGIDVVTRVEEGDRAGAISDLAAEVKADLIVMTTHGRTGMSRWIIGSVTERVMNDAPCPVLAVRAQSDCLPDRPTNGVANRILVPLDGSELAELALGPALAIAKRVGGELILFRVAQPQGEVDPGQNEMMIETPESVGSYQDRVAAACREHGVATATMTVTPGGSGAAGIANAILDFAAAQQVNLIAISTHGRSGLRRWVYGSVTEKVLHNADIATLIVRP